MKIRNGFVSNSSSSSFIVAFKKVPKSVAEMQKMLFGDEPYYKNPYFYPEDKKYGSEPSWLAQEVSIRVFNDMKDIIQPNEIAEEYALSMQDCLVRGMQSIVKICPIKAEIARNKDGTLPDTWLP